MLLSDADRDRLVDALGHHASEGRLGVEELERRVTVVLEAQSREDAVAVLADLPPLGPPAPSRRRGRGHGEADVAAPDWLPTNERFRDPRSNRITRVWVDTAGGRHYVAEEQI
ncbi:MAG TPA: DUF1707 domain-containing protein [Solirubrobacteraceae bacterium]|nr:DUF1707 domain-containing protein [Solirubrobacteraceae bacterium]